MRVDRNFLRRGALLVAARLSLRRWTPQAVRAPSLRAFSLLELLVSMAVLSLFAVLLFAVTDHSFKLWRSTQSDVEVFQSARSAYDILTRRLSRATLNTYLDYFDKDWSPRPDAGTEPARAAAFVPARYGRRSDLAFYSGPAADLVGSAAQGHGVFFFAPLGYTAFDPNYDDLPNLLNAVGYYTEWADDSATRPAPLSGAPAKFRFRLMEAIQPSQDFTLYPKFTDPTAATDNGAWIPDTIGTASTDKHPLAENIIALIIRPEITTQDASLLGLTSTEKITADYIYDSRVGAGRATSPEDLQFAQLPPLLRVVMVAVSERDAARLTKSATPPDALRLDSAWFADPSRLDADLDALGRKLANAGVQFRIFNQVIPIRSAKFSAVKEK